ncbi:MAG TPA: hypothetical protein VNC50_04015 [Planctomycetia bacterium]|nr:hypothetical protein [Planctomycetia bacterium]
MAALTTLLIATFVCCLDEPIKTKAEEFEVTLAPSKSAGTTTIIRQQGGSSQFRFSIEVSPMPEGDRQTIHLAGGKLTGAAGETLNVSFGSTSPRMIRGPNGRMEMAAPSGFEAMGSSRTNIPRENVTFEGELVVTSFTVEEFVFLKDQMTVNATMTQDGRTAKVVMFDEDDDELTVEIKIKGPRAAPRAGNSEEYMAMQMMGARSRPTIEFKDDTGAKQTSSSSGRSSRGTATGQIESIRGSLPTKSFKPTSMTLRYPRSEGDPRRIPFKFEKLNLDDLEKAPAKRP